MARTRVPRTLRIATSQFPVSANVARNLSFIARHVEGAKRANARLVHFPEAALTGYFGVDFASFAELDWSAIAAAERELASLAAAARVWLVFGSYRPSRTKPYSCLRVVAPSSKLAATYDKIHLFDRNGENRECSAGRALKTLSIDGIRCGFLICNDSNRPSLYDRYRVLGAELLIHSYYNARSSRGKNVFDQVISSQLRTRAFDHGFWISASNSSARYSRLAACLAAPDGRTTGCVRHRASIVVNDVRV
ncbi:MAG TPA: carbon-nitrogen hydrolase family protein [Polyangiaceae bacterium]|jgi:predicted amidohydrolase